MHTHCSRAQRLWKLRLTLKAMAVVGPSWQKAFLHVVAQGFRVIAVILSPLSFHKRKKNKRRQIYALNTFPLGPVS